MEKVRLGVLSTAKIGTEKVIPAMQKGKFLEVTAISSRNIETAKKAAEKLDIPKTYGSYDELLADKDIDAVYVPLPNHLHIDWSIKALQAGKHVLCEKPAGMDYKDALRLDMESKNFPHLKVMEAFMYRFHPQMVKTKKLIKEGRIGEIKNIHTMFSYFNINPDNIRNKADIGGGGLMDIGCYCISLSRFIFEDEPEKVSSFIEYDPEFHTDRFVAATLKFKNGTSQFSCSTQMFNNQFAEITGTKGRILIPVPYTPMPEEKTSIKLQTGEITEEFNFEACDKYTIQGDLFAQAILNNTEVPTPFSDALNNMKVIDSIKRVNVG